MNDIFLIYFFILLFLIPRKEIGIGQLQAVIVAQPTLLPNGCTPRVKKTFCSPRGALPRVIRYVLKCLVARLDLKESVGRSVGRSVDESKCRGHWDTMWTIRNLAGTKSRVLGRGADWRFKERVSPHISLNNFTMPLKGLAFVSAAMAPFQGEESSRTNRLTRPR